MNEHKEEALADGEEMCEVDAVGSTRMDHTSVTAHFGEAGINPGDQIKLSGMSKHDPLKNCRARALTVIETRMFPRGSGSDANPRRLVTQYWALDGTLLAEADKYAGDTIDRLEEQAEFAERAVRGLREQVKALVAERDRMRNVIADHEAQISRLSKRPAKKRTKKAAKKKATKKKARSRR